MGAPLTEELDPAEQEYVGGELYQAFESLLQDGFGLPSDQPLPPPDWGPIVHRWGAATTKIATDEQQQPIGANATAAEGRQEEDSAAAGAAIWPAVGVAVAGDFLTPPASAASAEAAGCIENALGSGLEAAEAILRAVLADVEPKLPVGGSDASPKL
jgi:hypothetical protein